MASTSISAIKVYITKSQQIPFLLTQSPGAGRKHGILEEMVQAISSGGEGKNHLLTVSFVYVECNYNTFKTAPVYSLRHYYQIVRLL